MESDIAQGWLRALARRLLPQSVRRGLVALRSDWRSALAGAIGFGRPRLIVRRTAALGRLSLVGLCEWVANGALTAAIRLAPRFARWRVSRGMIRSLWGVTPILTLPLKAKADQKLGFQSQSIVYTSYIITSDFDINLSGPYLFALGLGCGPAFQRLVLAWALLRYDIFHFFADRGILDAPKRLQINLEELAMMRAAKKLVYVYAYGADVRLRQATLALGRWNFCVDCKDPPTYCTCDDTEGEAYIAKLSKLVTAEVSLGDMLAYMPAARHINYWPIDIDRFPSGPYCSVSGPLRIAHAPNHTHFKGSSYLEQAINTLRVRGHDIEYVKIQGVPNTQVIELFRHSDIVADQFIGGAYGYTALEAMALAKPVLSFVRHPHLVEAPEECPILNATPDIIEEVLLWVLGNRHRLSAIGAQGRAYVERWHSIDAVASRFGKLYGETAGFPSNVLRQIEAQGRDEIIRRNSVAVVHDWTHPYQVERPLS